MGAGEYVSFVTPLVELNLPLQVPGVVGPDLADLHRLQGNHSLRADQPEEAKRIYGEANKLLDELERLFADTESVLVATPSQELGQNAVVLGASTMVPALLASILRQHSECADNRYFALSSIVRP